MNVPSEQLTAWVAGFYEGEGSIHCQITKSGPRIMFTIPQVNREPLELVMKWLDSIGCERHTLYYKVNRTSGNLHEVRTCNYPDNLKIFLRLKDYLSARRRDQFDDELDKFLEHSVRYGNGVSKRCHIPN